MVKLHLFIEALQLLRPNSPYTIDGQELSGLNWIDKNTKKPTEEEIQAKIEELQAAEPLRLLRIERDRKLSEVDWIVIRATSQGVPLSQEWIDYMQALRDLPTTATPEINEYGELINVIWPEKPNG